MDNRYQRWKREQELLESGPLAAKTAKTTKTAEEGVFAVSVNSAGSAETERNSFEINAECVFVVSAVFAETPSLARGPNHAAQLLKAHNLSPEGLERCLADLRQIRDIFYTSSRAEPIDPDKALLPPLPAEVETYYGIVRQLPMQVPARFAKEAKRRGLDPVTWERFFRAARDAGHIVMEPLRLVERPGDAQRHQVVMRYRLADAVTNDHGELLPGRWKQLLKEWQSQLQTGSVQ